MVVNRSESVLYEDKKPTILVMLFFLFVLHLCLNNLVKMPRLDFVAQQNHLYPYFGISFGRKIKTGIFVVTVEQL